ncbi:MAG TPA: endonuclease/exonuclease/phosphatase family protein [Steroidobacteraceae bacterium]|nr:endonuclease/exonuclease/phosphatase family protein [Steroidobacteraceae bacterium]
MAAAVALAPVLPWYFGGDEPAAGTPTVRLFVANVYYGNPRKRLLLERVAEASPDVVALVEVNSAWLHRLRTLRARYPYRFELPDEAYVGLAIYSRFPIEEARVLDLRGGPATPTVAARIAAPGGAFELVLAHPPSPESAERIARRNAEIRALARYAARVREPLVVAGDFNLAMWNTGYEPLAEVGGLHNARQGHGAGPTWPAPWPVGVPIDQILGSPQVRFGNFRVLGPIGSDHLPLFTELSTR